MVGSGLKVTVLPVRLVFPTFSSFPILLPPSSNVILQISFPSCTVTLHHVHRAFTTLAPTPCNPPALVYPP